MDEETKDASMQPKAEGTTRKDERTCRDLTRSAWEETRSHVQEELLLKIWRNVFPLSSKVDVVALSLPRLQRG